MIKCRNTNRDKAEKLNKNARNEHGEKRANMRETGTRAKRANGAERTATRMEKGRKTGKREQRCALSSSGPGVSNEHAGEPSFT